MMSDEQGNGIGWAVKAMRNGERVRRSGWNGRGMWLALQQGYPTGVAIDDRTATGFAMPAGNMVVFDPYVVMRTVTGSIVPWLCSQTDLLAADWEAAA